jgi:putative phage-type endonuclease
MPINHEMRKSGVAASDVGAIFGVDPNRDAFSVVAEKKGDLPPIETTDRMRVGKAIEPGILALYSYRTGYELDYCDQTMRHPEREWMIYTPDALVRGERRGVDAKSISFDQRRNWGPTADDIPEKIQLQCWYYMAALDYDVWDVAAFMGDGMPRIYTIERDLEAERVMLARCEEFYLRYLKGDEMPPMGASASAAAWLQRAFPTHKRPDLRRATQAEEQMLAAYAGVRADQIELQRERDELENSIKLAIADREGLLWPDGKFTWRKTKDREVVDYKSLSLGLINQFIPDAAERKTLVEFYTTIKPGIRRIYFDCDLVAAEVTTEV